MKNKFLTVKQVAELLGQMTEKSILNLIKKGEIPATRIGRKYFIPVSFLEEKAEDEKKE